MTRLPELLFAGLLLRRRTGRAGDRREIVAPGYDRDDLNAARDRARKRA
jgi:hypothetical protein